MYIAVTIKRYRAVKEVGKIKMSVGIVAYYQVMQFCQRDQQFFPGMAVPPLAKQAGYGYMHLPAVPQFAGVLPSAPDHFMPAYGIEFQPTERCPKNLIVFDQTDQRRQIMFNPAMATKLVAPDFLTTAIQQENFKKRCVNHVEEVVTSDYIDDSHDIDALLNSEEEDYEDYEDDEVSTARNRGNYGCNSPDSFSTDGYKSQKNRLSTSVQKSSDSSCSYSFQRKRQKVKQMVNVLRGIVPGGEQMSTVTILDEAVGYLKSLKVEVQKLGLGNLNE